MVGGRRENSLLKTIRSHPISPNDLARIQQFGKKVVHGIFLGCELIAVRI